MISRYWNSIKERLNVACKYQDYQVHRFMKKKSQNSKENIRDGAHRVTLTTFN